MVEFSTGEIALIVAVAVIAGAYVLKIGPFADKDDDPWAGNSGDGGALAALASGGDKGGAPDTRVLKEAMEQTGKHTAVFFGSQTGTAEDLAVRYAREIKSTYGRGVLVCDLEDFDFDSLDDLPEDALLVFMIATYGEGEPTDNAAEFKEFITNEDVEFSKGGSSLEGVKFQLFALGNSTYEFYCKAGRDIDEALVNLGAQRIGERGEGDDDKRMEDYYLTWKDPALRSLETELGWDSSAGGDVVDFKVTETKPKPESLYQGELSQRMLVEAQDPTSAGLSLSINARNPLNAVVDDARELFVQDSTEKHHCVHVSFNIADTGLRYQTGDHVAVWPMNAEENVHQLAQVLGLSSKLDTAIDIESFDPQLSKVPFPTPTTYGAALRYYLDISQLAGRQSLGQLANFAPNASAKEKLRRASQDPEYYDEQIGRQSFTLAAALEWAVKGSDSANLDAASDDASSSRGLYKIPFDRIVSSVPRLQPRFYSISSSPKLFPDNIHLTAVVERWQSELPADESVGTTRNMYGITSNYLLSVKNEFGKSSPADPMPHYNVPGPRNYYVRDNQVHIPIHVRHSTFRLPTNTKTPVILVGPGTGVAPFRGFVQERVALANKAAAKGSPIDDWGVMRLYYGCRYAAKDFLYKDEWDKHKQVLGDKFQMRTALSRDPDVAPRQYVQDLIREDADAIYDALANNKGYFYICGDAKHMAREVEQLLETILGRNGQDGARAVKSLKDRGRYQTDVWS